MKKIKGKLVKRNSQTQLNIPVQAVVQPGREWTKYDERLIECVENEDVERIRATLLKKGTSSVKLDPKGTTALHTACLKGNVNCLDALLLSHPDLSVVDKSGCNALHIAARAGNTECVDVILQHKVHISSQDGRKMTALHHAAAKGHQDCVELLLNNNAPLNVKDKDGRTPLLMGVQSAHEDVVRLLLERGAKVNIVDNAKKTALMYASLLGLSKNVELLLKRGANSQLKDSNNHTAEDYAKLCGYMEIIEQIKSAPQVATWDAGEDTEDTEQEDADSDLPNGELISEFQCSSSSPEEGEETSIASKSVTDMSVNEIQSSLNSGRSSLQESFSSKASTANLSSPRMMKARDLTDDIKELEEENEMLNQELNKLRVQHQKTMERMRALEAKQEEIQNVENSKSAKKQTKEMNGHVEGEVLKEKEKRIEELEEKVFTLGEELKKERRSRSNAEEEKYTLQVQLASYQDDTIGESGFSDNEDDVDLPGVDLRGSKHKSHRNSQSDLVTSLHGQITTLKLENETLKEQIKTRVNGDVDTNSNLPSIPLPVYNELKESSEQEVFKLNEEVTALKGKNHKLKQEVSTLKSGCQKCIKQSKLNSDVGHKEKITKELDRLQYQLAAVNAEYRNTVNIYRLQLLSAYQGELDPEVEKALKTIVSCRSSEQFC